MTSVKVLSVGITLALIGLVMSLLQVNSDTK